MKRTQDVQPPGAPLRPWTIVKVPGAGTQSNLRVVCPYTRTVEACPEGDGLARYRGGSLPDEWVNQALTEHTRLADRQQDPELRAVMTALFLEDLTGVVLTDEDIDPGLLSSHESLRKLLRSKARIG